MENIDVSVIVLTYNTELKRTINTIDSIIKQKNISYEIIISDDGSPNNHFTEIEEYLEENNIKKFLLLEHTKNQGTVHNLLDAVKKAKGKYVKALGAGDLLYDNYVLGKWFLFMEEEAARVSFCDAKYFRNRSMGKKTYIKAKDNPQRPNVYLKKNIDKMKKYFLLYNDLILGAKFMVERKLLEKYLCRVSNAVKLAEDNIFRIMLCDNIPFSYFNEVGICYEYGTGIWSSKNSKYSGQLQQDWNNTNEIIGTYCSNNFFGKRLRIRLENENSIFIKVKKRIILFDTYIFKMIVRIFPRYTN